MSTFPFVIMKFKSISRRRLVTLESVFLRFTTVSEKTTITTVRNITWGRSFIMHAPEGGGGGPDPICFSYLRNVKKCVWGAGGVKFGLKMRKQ